MNSPKISKILCATDFSPFASKALGAAIMIARQHGAVIEALHVFPTAVPFTAGDVPYEPVVIPVDPASRRLATDELDRFIAAAADEGVPASMAMVEGDPSTVILDRALSGGADLIAMGTHGRRGFDRWLMGSVAERVLAKSHCPVLTMAAEPETPTGWPRRPAPRGATRRILCALDLSEHSAKTLAYARFLAVAAHAKLSAFTVVEELFAWDMPGEALSDAPLGAEIRAQRELEALKRLEALVPAKDEALGEIDRIAATGPAHLEILRAAREHGANLLVLGIHGRPALGVSLLGSTARHVVREAPCPVITVRPS